MLQNTPIEKYRVEGQEVFVKREDLSCIPPGPPFAKVRGLFPVLKNLKEQGIETVGYMDTSISMAGWGISYFCRELGMKSVVFMPSYKDGFRHNQEYQISKWKEFGAKIYLLERPNRMVINFYRARKILEESYPGSRMLPQGLPFKETVEEVSNQLLFKTGREVLGGTIVSCVGSGAMLAGILKGCFQMAVGGSCYGILVSKKSSINMREKILGMAGLVDGYSFFNRLTVDLVIIDYGYEYTEEENCWCPFPCNSYYDRKAWKWLLDNMKSLKSPILFWNIGA